MTADQARQESERHSGPNSETVKKLLKEAKQRVEWKTRDGKTSAQCSFNEFDKWAAEEVVKLLQAEGYKAALTEGVGCMYVYLPPLIVIHW